MTCLTCKQQTDRDVYWSDPAAAAARARTWHADNRERSRRNSVNYITRRRKEDPLYAMKCRVQSMVCKSLSARGYRKRSRTAAILGCSIDEFIAHIERQFLKGMSWENRHLWQIDHITPLATAETEADVIALNHFTNLRPLWGPDNLAKRDKVQFLI